MSTEKKILIIDDEPDVNIYLSTILESNGYKTYSVLNCDSAVEMMSEIEPDLVCLDIMMPHETGISFYVFLRRQKEYLKIPVIIISGVVEKENFDIYSYIDEDNIPAPDCFMEKPIQVEKFLNRVEELLN